ncbi:MAG: L,D-transpeptidase [Chthoniobacterales bacterium]
MKVRLPILLLSAALAGCTQLDNRHVIHISVADQKMLVTEQGQPVASYPVSTSKFGLGSQPGSYATPLGKHRVVKKIGHGLPPGAVFKSRRFTGEVLPVDAPGRDPIVTRILWLDGKEPQNRNSFGRFIYIHGTPEERNIGRPVSYGCIRMRSRDVVALHDRVGIGARIDIFHEPLARRLPKLVASAEPDATPPAAEVPVTMLAGDPPETPRGL